MFLHKDGIYTKSVESNNKESKKSKITKNIKNSDSKIMDVAGGQIVLINDIVDYHFDVLVICIIVVLLSSIPLVTMMVIAWYRTKMERQTSRPPKLSKVKTLDGAVYLAQTK